jgi:hypothetical protein
MLGQDRVIDNHAWRHIGGLRLPSEKVFKGLARIQRLGGGSLALDGGARQIKAAIVQGVFPRDAGSNRLGALKAGASVEKGALLATVQFKATLWTAAFEVNPDRQNHGAGSTP